MIPNSEPLFQRRPQLWQNRSAVKQQDLTGEGDGKQNLSNRKWLHFIMTVDKGGRRERGKRKKRQNTPRPFAPVILRKDAQQEPRKAKEEKEKPFRPLTLDIFLFLVEGILGKETSHALSYCRRP